MNREQEVTFPVMEGLEVSGPPLLENPKHWRKALPTFLPACLA